MAAIRIDLVQREGLDAFEVIGEERRCVLERRPTSTVVVEIVRKKFVRKSERGNDTTSVLIADPLSLPISKGLAGPVLLADTLIKRWLSLRCLTLDAAPERPAPQPRRLVLKC